MYQNKKFEPPIENLESEDEIQLDKLDEFFKLDFADNIIFTQKEELKEEIKEEVKEYDNENENENEQDFYEVTPFTEKVNIKICVFE